MAKGDFQKVGNDLEGSLDKFFRQAPQLPKGGRDVLVAIAPWIALIFGILGIVGGLALVGVSPLGIFGGIHFATSAFLTGVLAIVSSVLMVMAFPGLRAHSRKAWMLLFWSEVISVVSNVVNLQLVGAVVGGLIGFYLLYQIKSYYK